MGGGTTRKILGLRKPRIYGARQPRDYFAGRGLVALRHKDGVLGMQAGRLKPPLATSSELPHACRSKLR